MTGEIEKYPEWQSQATLRNLKKESSMVSGGEISRVISGVFYGLVLRIAIPSFFIWTWWWLYSHGMGIVLLFGLLGVVIGAVMSRENGDFRRIFWK